MKDVENSILKDIADLQDGLLRSEFLIRCGKAAPGIPKEERLDEDLAKNCQTKTWVHLSKAEDAGCLKVASDSLSLLIKGALALIGEIYEGRQFKEVAGYDCTLMDDPDFAALFSLDEQKGLRGITERIKNYCLLQAVYF